MDPQNPVVRLCGEGMQAEAQGRADDARALFLRAWESATDDYDACVAAHYLARHQPTPAETLRWNQECLRRADAVGDERVSAFYPSLHLNLGQAHRDLGDTAAAREHFSRAAEHMGDVPPGPYADWTRYAIAQGLRDTARAPAARAGDEALAGLLASLCARADLKALAVLLPAYVGDLGTDEDRARLTTALHMLHAGRSLPGEEQATAARALADLADPATSGRVARAM
ncbi:hypothetical protein [Streptomyces avicenniae]|uniref:hypothetical protein n=1 Tax=Streptomyces avicenniae TaxID=500153 RepID=UPI00069A621F|nr:hypothetical protein [Streptomyces avicenniae]